MAERGRDPYQTLGISPRASDDELRSTYRRLVQLHHPDHNGGSAESARRFEQIQEAHAEIRKQREATPRRGEASHESAKAPPGTTADPIVDSRIADLEQELREAHLARERARNAARDASAESTGRPSDEELGYVATDDSFSKILSDARDELADQVSEIQEHPVARRVADLIDELGSKLTGEPPPPRPSR